MRCLFLSLALLSVSPTAFAEDIGGLWRGTYQYDDGGSESYPFTIKMANTEKGFVGAGIEPNLNLPPEKKEILQSVIEGKFMGDNYAHWSKTYDGTGGWNHVVSYGGTLKGDEIEGRWALTGGPTGTFRMTRTPAANLPR